MNRNLFLALLFLTISFQTKAQDTLTSIKKARFIPIVAGSAIAYGTSLAYLSKAWYTKQDKTSFHFFNDLPEWKQMDKVGHFSTAFHESAIAADLLKWTGVSHKKAALFGSLAGFIYQTPIELLDAYSKEYGASVSDITANALGSASVLGQLLFWQELRIQPKWSFHTTRYATLRPNVLGKSLPEQMLKDYNGQTYWLSANLSSFFKNTRIPKWINISFGYGAQQMLYGMDNKNKEAGYAAYRQYYLSLDFDFRHVPIKKQWLKILLYPLNIIHIPFPTLEINKHGITFHSVYY